MNDLLKIPPRETMVVTHDDDPLEWYYKPVIKEFYLYRFKMVLDLIKKGLNQEKKALEIGFGSGILFPSLSCHFKKLYGADIHPNAKAVENVLREKHKLPVQLVTSSVYELPYENEYFDYVIGVSLLEQLEKLDDAILEMMRVTKKGGSIILGFPTKNALMHLLFRLLLLGRSDNDFHVSTHLDILESVKRHLQIEEIKTMPPRVPYSMAMYVACRCLRK